MGSGTGLGGLYMATHLKRAREDDFELFMTDICIKSLETISKNIKNN